MQTEHTKGIEKKLAEKLNFNTFFPMAQWLVQILPEQWLPKVLPEWAATGLTSAASRHKGREFTQQVDVSGGSTSEEFGQKANGKTSSIHTDLR